MEEWKFTVAVERRNTSPAFHWRVYRVHTDRRQPIGDGKAHTETEAFESARRAAADHKSAQEVLSVKRHEFTL